MSFEIKNVKLKNKEVKKICLDSFPKEERMPFALMVLLSKMNNTDFLAFYDKNILCGFVFMSTINDITFVMYLAVAKEIRSRGYGSRILKEIQTLYPNNKIIISVERCDVEAKNINDRIRRKNFYLKNGYLETGYLIELSKVEQEIIVKNGTLNTDNLTEFFRKYSNGTMNPKIWKK